MTLSLRRAACLAAAAAITIPAAAAAAPGDSAEFAVSGPLPAAITAGPDGNLWLAQYTELVQSGIGRLTPAGAFSGFTGGIAADAGTTSITSGPDGNLWFTGRFNPVPTLMRATTSGAVTTVASFPVNSAARSVVSGPDGNLWLALNDTIVRSTPAGVTTSFAMPVAPGPSSYNVDDMTSGPGGALWWVDRSEGVIGRATTAGAITVVANFAAGAEPTNVAEGPDGNLWVTLRGAKQIARVTPAGAISTFAVPSAPADLPDIAPGPDGNLWFTESAPSKLGRITTAGAITEYTIPRPGAAPNAITAGPDGNMWVADGVATWVARVLTGVTPTNTAAPAVTGTPKIGQRLTASNGSWKYLPTGYAYSWQRCASAAGAGCASIAGATAGAYTVTDDDLGKFLIASVTASNLNGASQAAVAPAATVPSLPALKVTWSRSKRTIRANITLRRGATGYRIAAVTTAGAAATRNGRCVRVTKKARTGTRTRIVRSQRCTITLPKGAWSVNVRGVKGPDVLAITKKAYRIR